MTGFVVGLTIGTAVGFVAWSHRAKIWQWLLAGLERARGD